MTDTQATTATGRVSREQLVALIVACLREVLATTSPDAGAQPACDEHTRLIGKTAVLDSMGLVTLIVDVEQAIESEFGAALILADDRAMSQTRSPFASVGSLADYAQALIEERS
jgi:acyl carrier protein